MKVTRYVEDADAATWERAKALTGDTEESLSSVVSELLRSYVERQEALRSAEETFFHDLNSSSRPWNIETTQNIDLHLATCSLISLRRWEKISRSGFSELAHGVFKMFGCRAATVPRLGRWQMRSRCANAVLRVV
jgi:hypothetical protein